jgi:hypothetical protein
MPSITLTIDAAAAQRVAAAFGRYWHLADAGGAPRDATLAEVKTYLVRQMAGVVRNAERAQAEAAAAAGVTDVAVS